MRWSAGGEERLAAATQARREATLYWRLAVAGFRRQSQYKLAMLAGLFTNCVFGLVRAAVMLAAVRGAGDFGGYDEGTVGAYVWLTQGLLGAMQFMGPPLELVDRVKNGDVAIDFLRPVDIQLGYLAADLGRAACTLGPRFLPSVLFGFLTVGLVLPSTPGPYVLGALSMVLSVSLSFLLLFAIGLIGFWVVETRGIRVLYQICGTFLAGLFVPVHMFPDWLRTLANATPFPSILQAPVDVLSGRILGMGAMTVVGIQLFWVLAIATIGRMMLAAGRRRLEVQGG
ncbi:ABC transporter permease [Nocardia lijiangensis]|uniref:ABC transporter permease n=1 Tax=Nocardia lijiangensis TaxID=299618 RepID=UPI003D739D4E